MRSVSRRDFVKSSIATGLVAALPFSRVRGANNRIRVGLVGCGGRGTGDHIPSFERQEGVAVVAVSDPDQERMAGAAKIIESRHNHKADQYVNMREMFDSKDIDVIANATQNYWHGLSTIWACQGGKHVYVEKPLSHYIWEGRQMVNAARKYNSAAPSAARRVPLPRPSNGSGKGTSAGSITSLLLPTRHVLHAANATLRSQFPTRSTMTSGAAQRRKCQSIAIGSNMTAALTGTPVTENPVIRVYTRWMWPAGAWVRRVMPGR